MNFTQIETNVQNLIQDINLDSFIYDLLLAYGQPKATITRLQKGGMNLSKNEGELLWKKKLLFKTVGNDDVHRVIDELKTDEKLIRHDPRFVIVTDFETLLSIEMNIQNLEHIREKEMPLQYKGFDIGTRRVDFLVEEKISVEIKAVIKLEDVHLAQAINYLEAYNLEIGLLISFGAKSLEFKRLINSKYKGPIAD